MKRQVWWTPRIRGVADSVNPVGLQTELEEEVMDCFGAGGGDDSNTEMPSQSLTIDMLSQVDTDEAMTSQL